MTLLVWKIPESPPKAVAQITGRAVWAAGRDVQRLCIPVVISAMPVRRAREDKESRGSVWIHWARMENSII